DETGCALLVIEHDMPLIAAISDRMMALDQGRVIATGGPRAVLEDNAVVASYLGDDASAIARSGAATPVAARCPGPYAASPHSCLWLRRRRARCCCSGRRRSRRRSPMSPPGGTPPMRAT